MIQRQMDEQFQMKQRVAQGPFPAQWDDVAPWTLNQSQKKSVFIKLPNGDRVRRNSQQAQNYIKSLPLNLQKYI